MKILVRRDTTNNWTMSNHVLELGEIGLDVQTHEMKMGDGVTGWTALESFNLQSIDGGTAGVPEHESRDFNLTMVDINNNTTVVL